MFAFLICKCIKYVVSTKVPLVHLFDSFPFHLKLKTTHLFCNYAYRGFRQVKKLRDRGDALGRITQVHFDTDGDERCVYYDVEWLVIGGASPRVADYYLKPTTAAEEGLTVTRRREKRKPSTFEQDALRMDSAKAARRAQLKAQRESKAAQPQPQQPSAKKSKSASTKKAKATTTTTSTTKKQSSKETKKASSNSKASKKPPPKSDTKKPATKKAPKKSAPANAKRKSSSSNESNAGKKRKLSASPAVKDAEPAEPESTVAPKGMDLYKKQSREFDRIMARLEKIDPFGWFWDPVPPEFEEKYDDDDGNDGGDDDDDETKQQQQSSEQEQPKVRQEQPAAQQEQPEPQQEQPKAQQEQPEAHQEQPASQQEQPEAHQEQPAAQQQEKLVAQQEQTQEQTAPPIATSSEKDNEKTNEKAKKVSKNAAPKSPYPDHPPYNWEMIRRRKANGRYELNRAAREEKEYMAIMRPYYRSVGRRPKKSKVNPRVLYPVGVHWELFHKDVVAMMEAARARAEDPTIGGRTSLETAIKKLREALDVAVERTGRRQDRELRYYDDRHRFDNVLKQQSNTEAAMQSWRRNPFPERRYERLRKDVVSAGLSDLDERIASYELKTSLPDSFIGLSYRYDDTGQSEAWMQSVVEESGVDTKGSQAKQAAEALAADEGVVRAQVNATIQSLLIGVQDRVMTEMGVLQQPELVSANWIESEDLMQEDPMDQNRDGGENITPEIVEQPVWGIDCYTRRNILICLEHEFDPKTSLTFVEKWLLPAINACPPDIASDISNAARILEGLPFQMPSEEDRVDKIIEDENESKSVQQWSHTVLGNALVEKIKKEAPPWLKAAANFVRRARESLGPNFFRVHPKGHGSVLLSPRVPPNRLVTYYRGEIYPAWRWGEKMDAIEITQQRKGLRPTLPDFYNMALERPQMDPRGYGLLFVDASRKGGHGSALSHSCQPTCEVRVAAMNGELCLAMTTIRELETGEELTFDYNAATDSLNEYQSAVCLCGYGKCRGSFLHFATADCYQKVMNRNCPIATRFSNLIKGCMKQVMSEDDEKVLKSHGFRTAAFGAISVNRRDAETVNENLSDTMQIVPVWLKTYAADTLRYIEYERRALPITLICDQMSPDDKEDDKEDKDAPENKKGPKGPTKPETSFFFFSRRQADRIGKFLKEKGIDKTGLELQIAKQKIAAAYWNKLSDEKKEFWKKEAIKDFERKTKEFKAEQALARKKANAKKTSKSAKAGLNVTKDMACRGIDFQDADAEGVSAMEHRIQHLTQTLSRVGRVLDRHREGKLQQESSSSLEDESLRDVVNSPLKVLSDSEVIRRLWVDDDSIVQSLGRFMETGGCVSKELRDDFVKVLDTYGPSLDSACNGASLDGRKTLKRGMLELRSIILKNLQIMLKVFRKYKALLNSEKGSRSTSPNPSISRDLHVQYAHTESPAGTTPEPMDSCINTIDGNSDILKGNDNGDSTEMEIESGSVNNDHSNKTGTLEKSEESEIFEAEKESPVSSVEAEKQGEANIRLHVQLVISDIVEKVESIASSDENGLEGKTSAPKMASEFNATNREKKKTEERDITSADMLLRNPWIEHYGDRITLEAAADVILLYANTSNFFVTNQYTCLQSTPIEVYARELGNAVPKTAIDKELLSPEDARILEEKKGQGKSKSNEKDESFLCSPDDVVAKVTVKYGGEYVLSQLLQWYNGGIGQKPGLPDLSGCVALPHISGCFASSIIPKKKIRSDKKTVYDTRIRQRLVEWLQDPYKRGDPLPDDVKEAFYSGETDQRPVDRVLFGSPVLDFLVMGDESNIFETLDELDSENKICARSALDDALSTVDRGRPAQAVCRWVQCENPDCLKWRKIPWHVDIDLLPETFFCKDNKWDPSRTSCDAPEDDWDADDKLVGADGKVEGSPIRKNKTALPSRETDFRVGAKFDVRRKVKGKDKFALQQ